MIYAIYVVIATVIIFLLIHLIMFINFKKHYIPVLMYHRITDCKKDDNVRYTIHKGNKLDLDSMKVSPLNFEKQMNYLYKKKYRVLKLDESIFFKNKKNVFVTFDDGYHDNYKFAYPILKKNNQVGIFYLTAKLLDESKFMPIDENDKKIENRLLTWEEVMFMNNNNMQIGSHTNTHMWLNDPSTDLVDEIINSKNLIKERTNIIVDTFAYPGGLYNEDILELVRRNYKTAVITSRGKDFPIRNKDVFLIERETISSKDSMFMFKFKLHGYHRFIRKLSWLNKLRRFIKWILGR